MSTASPTLTGSALARAPHRRDLRGYYLFAAVVMAVIFWQSFRAVEFDPGKLWKNREFIARYVSRGMPPTGFPLISIVDPNTAPPLVLPTPEIPEALSPKAKAERRYLESRWAQAFGLPNGQELRVIGLSGREVRFLQAVVRETIITIQLALVATTIATLLTLPLTFLAAKNTAPPWAVAMTRLIFNGSRSIDALIIALIFVAAVGAGAFAGTLAIIIHSIGNLGKMFSEAVEEIDHGQVEALQAVGARGTEVIRWAIIPQVLPLWITYFLFRFELNVRVSVVLGLVGAGGIGALLNSMQQGGEYRNLWAIVFVIMVLVLGIDELSTRLRAKVH